MEQLKISREVSLPLDAVTQTIAVIARRGMGKTYLASKLAEEMLDAGAQVMVVDPVGVWYGLRVGADGKSKGKDIFIIGGEHGDIPLVPGAGGLVARLLVEKPVSVVLDISEMRKGERMQFLTAFGEEFFHLKKRQRSPVHLFLEEAQILLPQRFGKEQARMQGAWTDIVRLGRNYGIGETMISQRPQSIDKEVLNMTECLFVLQVNGVQERKALEDWVQEKGADRTLIGELPGLHRGEGFVWSPSWLRMFKKVHILAKTTFDGSSTPEVGKRVKAATMSAMDVEALKEKLQAVVEEAAEDDPKVLRRKIVELERKIAAAPVPVPAPVTVQVPSEPEVWEPDWESVCEKFDLTARLDGLRAALRGEIEAVVNSILGGVAGLPREILLDELKSTPMKCVKGERVTRVTGWSGAPAPDIKYTKPGSPVTFPTRTPPVPLRSDIGEESGLRGRVLRTLAEWEALKSTPMRRIALSGLAQARGGYFENTLSKMKTEGLITYPVAGLVALTDAGRKVAPACETAIDNGEMYRRVRAMMAGLELRVFDALYEVSPDSLERTKLSEMVGARGGYFENTLSKMKTREFIYYPNRGEVAVSGWLFVEAAR